MIDWVTCRFPYSGPPLGVVWIKHDLLSDELKTGNNLPIMVEGSFSSKIQVQVIDGEMAHRLFG